GAAVSSQPVERPDRSRIEPAHVRVADEYRPWKADHETRDHGVALPTRLLPDHPRAPGPGHGARLVRARVVDDDDLRFRLFAKELEQRADDVGPVAGREHDLH